MAEQEINKTDISHASNRNSGAIKAAVLLRRNYSCHYRMAENVGKLLGNNIAEALQGCTSASINSNFGVGDSVSIRGLS